MKLKNKQKGHIEIDYGPFDYLELVKGIALLGSVIALLIFIITDSNKYGIMSIIGYLIYIRVEIKQLRNLIENE